MPQAPTAAQPAPSSAAENAAARRGKPADPGQLPDPYGQSQVWFRTVFENAPLGQKILTPDLTMRQANLAVVTMLGCASVADLVGRKILEFAHPDHRADWQELQERLWEHKMPAFTLKTCIARVAGSSFWCQVHSVLFPDEEGELGYTILENISERKGLEQKLRRVYDAQETILQLATHDLKGPIVYVELLTDLLQREVASRSGEGSPPAMMRYLGLIQAACAHAHSLLQNVLYVGDLDQNGLQRCPTALPAYLSAELNLHRLAAQEKSLTLALPAEAIQVRLHPEKFGRVLNNLLHNALEFTPAWARWVPARTRAKRASRCRTRASVFPASCTATSSTSSTPPTGPAPVAKSLPASACSLPSRLWNCTAATSGLKATIRKAPPSSSSSPDAGRRTGFGRLSSPHSGPRWSAGRALWPGPELLPC